MTALSERARRAVDSLLRQRATSVERCGQLLTEAGVTETSLLVPGVNQTVLSLLLLHGFRQTSLGLFLATRPAGDWSHYLLFHSALP